jgi:hypothetical protein
MELRAATAELGNLNRISRLRLRPIRTNRSSSSECSGSSMSSACSSRKTVCASAKEIPCFLRFDRSFRGSHSNRSPATTTLYVQRTSSASDPGPTDQGIGLELRDPLLGRFTTAATAQIAPPANASARAERSAPQWALALRVDRVGSQLAPGYHDFSEGSSWWLTIGHT